MKRTFELYTDKYSKIVQAETAFEALSKHYHSADCNDEVHTIEDIEKRFEGWAKLTNSQYKIIADRMVEEHRKYGDKLRPGHWADVAARKVVSHMDDFREDERVFTESEVKAVINF